MILGMTLSYAAIKFIDLYQGNDPNIRPNSIPDSFGPDDLLTFTDDINFRLAVGARLVGGEETLKYDPQIVRWFAVMTLQDSSGDF